VGWQGSDLEWIETEDSTLIRQDEMYSSVISRHLLYWRLTKKRVARLSIRSAFSSNPNESFSSLSASVKTFECLYYDKLKKHSKHFVKFGEIDESNKVSTI